MALCLVAVAAVPGSYALASSSSSSSSSAATTTTSTTTSSTTSSTTKSYDVVIIGGGSAGLTAAKVASTFGKSSVIIEQARMGGDCTWTGW